MKNLRFQGGKVFSTSDRFRQATLSQLRLVRPHARELQQLCDDLVGARYVPFGKRALGRVSDGSGEDVLGGELQLNRQMLARRFCRDQRDG